MQNNASASAAPSLSLPMMPLGLFDFLKAPPISINVHYDDFSRYHSCSLSGVLTVSRLCL